MVSCFLQKQCSKGKTMVDRYSKLELLGQGTYATVYKGKNRSSEEWVALKEIALDRYSL